MTECYLQVENDDAPVHCDNCGWEGVAGDLVMVSDIQERLTPGYTVPAGQCPEAGCGALAYLTEPGEYTPIARLKDAERKLKCEEVDAARWRALMSSQRMHFMGAAGFTFTPKDGDEKNRKMVNLTPSATTPINNLHFGMEFWDKFPNEKYPEHSDSFERELLTVYVDELISRTNNRGTDDKSADVDKLSGTDAVAMGTDPDKT